MLGNNDSVRGEAPPAALDVPVKVKKYRLKKKFLPDPQDPVHDEQPRYQAQEERAPTPEARYQPDQTTPDAQLRSEMQDVDLYANPRPFNQTVYTAFQPRMQPPAMNQPFERPASYAQLPPNHDVQPVYEEQHADTYIDDYLQHPDDQLRSDDSNWDVNIQKSIKAARNKEKQALAEYNADRLALNTQLQEVSHANQVLEDQVQSLRTEKHGLAELVEQHKTKFSTLDQKANKFKTYLNGLGADLDGLMKEVSARRESSEQFASELVQRKSDQQALMEQSAKLKSDVLSVARETNSALQTATFRMGQLEKELGEKSHVLAEEKSARLSVQNQLLTATTSSDAVSRELKSHTDSVLDKLYEIHADVDEGGSDDLTEMLEKMVAATQAFNSQQAATAEDVAFLKGIMDSFSQSFSSHFSTSGRPSTPDTSFQSHLDEALKALKTDLCQQEKLVIQATADQEAISRLKHQLQESNGTVSEKAADLEKSQEALTSLTEQYAALKALAKAEKTMPVCSHADELRELGRIRDDLQSKTDEFQAKQAESVKKATEIQGLQDDNARLRTEIESLQQIQANPGISQDDVDAAIKLAKDEATKNANDYAEQEKIKCATLVKKTNATCDGLKNRCKSLEAELKSAKADATSSDDQQQELLRLQELVNGHETEVQNLHARIDGLNGTIGEHDDVQGKYKALNASFENQKQQLLAGDREKEQLDQKLKSVQSELNSSKQEVQSAKQDLDQCKTDAENELRAKEEKCKKRVDDLQAHLTQVQTEMRTQITEFSNFQQQLQEGWQEHEKAQKEQVARLTNIAAESQAECERLRAEMAKLASKSHQAAVGDRSSGSQRVSVDRHPKAAPALRQESPVLGPVVQESQQVNYTHSHHFGNSSPQSASDHAADQDEELPTFSQFNQSQSQPFSIFEDPPETGRPAPRETFKFQKMPPPNSSVKLVRSGSHASQRSQEGLYRLNGATQPSPRYMTPERRVDVSIPNSNVPGHVEQSSSPRSTEPNPFELDSRTARVAPPKRKAESQVVQGYDSQRKKQGQEGYGRRELRSTSTSQPMSRTLEESGLLNQMPDAGPVRMRTLAGSSARPARGTKKLSKNDAMNARFARELNK